MRSGTAIVDANTGRHVPERGDTAGEASRAAALARVHELYGESRITLERFSWIVEQLLHAHGHADLERAMETLPPIVALTPRPRRLDRALVLRIPDADLRLGPGWQLASHTTVVTGWGRARLDLAAASWDEQRVELRLETWGSIEVVVPRGVAVQIAGGSGGIRHDALSPALPGGPLLRVSRSGPGGLVRLRHPTPRTARRLARVSPARIAARRRPRHISVPYSRDQSSR